jgi:hypothetical protein
VLGDPFDDATTLGPLNNRPTADKMDRHVADAVERGGVVLRGGRAPGFPTDLYYDLTVIDRVSEEMLVAREESFGRSSRSSPPGRTTTCCGSPTPTRWASRRRCSPSRSSGRSASGRSCAAGR